MLQYVALCQLAFAGKRGRGGQPGRGKGVREGVRGEGVNATFTPFATGVNVTAIPEERDECDSDRLRWVRGAGRAAGVRAGQAG